jgi:acyl-CoA synthetase (AMP-forming)/AMP-acid ligase II
MQGMVQNAELLTSAALAHAAHVYPRVEIATAGNGRIIQRTTYGEADLRARCLASSLQEQGLAGEDVFLGALAFNTWRLFEVMHAVPGAGGVLHTANPRLHQRHLAYTVRHTGNAAVLVDLDCLPLAEAIAPACPSVNQWIIMAARAEMPKTALPAPLCYEELIEAGDPSWQWPQFDERRASTLCYTSATTGEPKGVLYSHRGTVLNVMSICGRNGWNLGRGDCVLAAAPFFHCNGWGMPYMAPMVGAKLVLPGRVLTPAAMLNLIRNEGVTHSGGVPTVLMDLLGEVQKDGGDFGRLRQLWTGATAPPESLIRKLEALGPKVIHAFGMTETTQALTISIPDPHAAEAEQRAEQICQGQPVFLSDVRVVDDAGALLPSDGRSLGHLQVRGPAVVAGYFRRPDLSPMTNDGWLDTGDIGTVGPTGLMTIRDRAKDAIKSGGEWISSLELENTAAGCPGIAEAACIGVEHPRWQERPLLLLVKEAGASVDESDVRTHLVARIARWWMPDAIVFLDALPRNGVGKVMKADLREKYRTILLKHPVAPPP